MKENIKMALKMVKVNIYELMAVFMKDNLIKIIYHYWADGRKYIGSWLIL